MRGEAPGAAWQGLSTVALRWERLCLLGVSLGRCCFYCHYCGPCGSRRPVRAHSLSVAVGRLKKKPNKSIQGTGKNSQGAITRRISREKHLQELAPGDYFEFDE